MLCLLLAVVEDEIMLKIALNVSYIFGCTARAKGQLYILCACYYSFLFIISFEK